MELLPYTPLFRMCSSLWCPLGLILILSFMNTTPRSNAALAPHPSGNENFFTFHIHDPRRRIGRAHPAPEEQPGNETDHLSLLAFRDAVSGSSQALKSWNDSLHYCQWPGIRCSRQYPGRVAVLNLTSLDLSGYISPWIANLTFLQTVDLSQNQLHGVIPPQVGSLSRLFFLDLSINFLEGKIPPNLSHCSELLYLGLRKNLLEGEIPLALGSLPKLVVLSIRSNLITGPLPPSLGNLSSAFFRGLDLTDNALTGSIPSTLGRLANMQYFGVQSNNLSGMLPPCLFNLSNLQTIDVAVNHLMGTLPLDLGIALPKLTGLYLGTNQFEGNIPSSLTNISSLQAIGLSSNKFKGTIPDNLGALKELYKFNVGANLLEAREPRDWNFFNSLTNCTYLRVLSLTNNKLRGALPNSVANLSIGLDTLMIADNQISESIPAAIANIRGLVKLSVGGNQMTGSIPSALGMLNNLVHLDVDNNQLSGEIPSELGNLTRLSELFLEFNKLSGSIPTSFGRCQQLQKLAISFNNLNGSIPEEVFTLSSLVYLSLSNNNMDGPLPSNIGHLSSLWLLDLSANRFSGYLPATLGDCQSIERLYLQRNSFEGTIPSTLKNLKGIVMMDLSINNLTGRIPEFLGSYKFLQYLNLSFNNFIGEVPKNGTFANSTAISLEGNKMICGGISALHLPTCMSQAENERNASHSLIAIVSIAAAGFCLLIFSCFISYLCWMRKSKGEASISSFCEVEDKKISYHDLVKATDGFSNHNLIGRGSFGSVYKGFLESENIVVAVKVLNMQRRGAFKSFKSECEALRSIRHRNLVKILSVCASIDSSGNDFKAIVFQFFPHGSLEKWLHPEPEEELRTLDFAERISIAVDVASALDYLHNHCHSPIIHCDLKPSNILLDDNMTAHVGDFGLARFILKMPSENFGSQNSTIGIKGTIGYVAPEYGLGSPVSTYGDVYSFGILLLELFTTKRPTDDAFKDDWNLQKFVQTALLDKALDIMDPHLILPHNEIEPITNIQNNNYSSREKVQECFVSLMYIGLNCTKESPQERLGMRDVVKEIHLVQETYLGVARSATLKTFLT